ncbi:MAG TPA: DMT family transporter [Ideonella sp.]|uniref:DMT family transporter n=1 Tax=Ideonella sp. TaxID=1929293 RepID=UPI002E36AA5C|nr:DMT family transporter [Ideonella sp.]HEX5684906.1 DMT family transporter [Ideonella sp.]
MSIALASPSFARPTVLDISEMLLLGLAWGASFLFMRVATPEFGPVALVALRVAVAALLLAPLLRGVWRHPDAGRWWRPVLMLGIFNSALPFCLFALSALSLPAGFSAVLNATAILWGATLGWAIFGARLGGVQALGLLLGVSGVVGMVAHKLAAAEPTAGLPLGVGAAVLATACYGACAHYTHRHLADAPAPLVAAGSQAAAALVLLVPGGLAWPVHPPSALAWGCALALGGLCTALAYLMYFRLIRRLGAGRAMTVTMLVPAFGVMLGVALLGEPLTPGIVLGGGLVLAGSALVLGVWPRSARRAPPSQEVSA